MHTNPGGYGGFRIGPGSISRVIKYLIGINAVIFLIQIVSSLSFIRTFGLTPLLFYREFPNYLFQPFTYMFLHGGLFHIFFNMFALWMFGTEIEYRWGSKPFLRYYLYCGLAGALFSLVFNPNLAVPIVGASGAIYGILIAYWLMFPDRYLLIFFMFPMRVRWAIPLFALLNFVASGPHVAHLAHLGGAVVGLAYIKLDWRLAVLGKRIKSLRLKRKTAKLEKNRQKAEDIMRRVDAILDKINEVGIENISKEDRKFLEDASQILSKEDN
ncbi:MAG: rhomboid family intramembrane serine protease [Candidatus Zixiibacteriota bacterium]|nr:MAG: rhomboid family intramembrane serine protease [candidate division Zixibacteria bacterium]